MEPGGHNPVANYDMSAIGLGGFVTSRGWVELANPGSSKLALKMFNINNVGSRSGKSNTTQTDDLEDIAELGEFKLAQRTLRSAGQLVCPWNLSFMAIENFMFQEDFCMTDLSGTENPAVTLAQFVDYIMHENANRWRDSEGFLQTGDLKAYSASFSSARPKILLKKQAVSTPVNSTTAQRLMPKGKQSASPFHSLPRNSPRLNVPFTDACKNWNQGRCKKAAGTCITSKGIPLRHVCNWSDVNNSNATPCGMQHQSMSNH